MAPSSTPTASMLYSEQKTPAAKPSSYQPQTSPHQNGCSNCAIMRKAISGL